MTDERRASPRRRTIKGGHIVVNDGFSTFNCTVRDMSEDGARLKVDGVIGIPDSFQLAMNDGQKFACTVAWRTEREIGVKFN